jgi:octaprenyl-diphosphate synthase
LESYDKWNEVKKETHKNKSNINVKPREMYWVKIGKNIGDDLADGKATMPLLHVLKHGTPEQKQLIELSLKDGALHNLEEVIKAIESTKAIEFTKNFAAQEVDKALTALEILPDSEYKTALIKLAYFSIQREH